MLSALLSVTSAALRPSRHKSRLQRRFGSRLPPRPPRLVGDRLRRSRVPRGDSIPQVNARAYAVRRGGRTRSAQDFLCVAATDLAVSHEAPGQASCAGSETHHCAAPQRTCVCTAPYAIPSRPPAGTAHKPSYPTNYPISALGIERVRARARAHSIGDSRETVRRGLAEATLSQTPSDVDVSRHVQPKSSPWSARR